MRTCVVGGGLAGALLAWRLAQLRPGGQVDLLLGRHSRVDATAASGGAVRAYETNPEQRRLAIASLTELLASPTLRRWSEFRPGEFVYLRPATAGLDQEVAELERVLPGSAQLLPAETLKAGGWAQLPPEAVGVQERQAGYLALGRFRDAVLADCAAHRRVRLVPASLTRLVGRPAGGFECQVAGAGRDYEQVVLAAGAWTRDLLARHQLAADYRTKAIQYRIYPTGAWQPPAFADEFTGVYGRPAGKARLLLGLATSQWGVAPDQPPVTPALHERAAQLVGVRFPALRLGEPLRTVSAVDCYASDPVLRLRSVDQALPGLFTFTGGAGGSAKTVLAASREAAIQLTDSASTKLLPLGPREGQP